MQNVTEMDIEYMDIVSYSLVKNVSPSWLI